MYMKGLSWGVSGIGYLNPLLKWRVLDLNRLLEESRYPNGYQNFKMMIRRLEKKGVVKSQRYPQNRRKYVYLSPEGEKFLSLVENPTCLRDETFFHDFRLTEIVWELYKLPAIMSVKLEHQLRHNGGRSYQDKVYPDAVLNCEKDGVPFTVALELEITRKTIYRIREKFRKYDAKQAYDYFLFVFSNEGIFASYLKHLKSEFGEGNLSRFMFFILGGIHKGDINIDDSYGILDGEPRTFKEVFGEK